MVVAMIAFVPLFDKFYRPIQEKLLNEKIFINNYLI